MPHCEVKGKLYGVSKEETEIVKCHHDLVQWMKNDHLPGKHEIVEVINLLSILSDGISKFVSTLIWSHTELI